MTNALHALVIGGSIGGLSAAHALLRAGCRVTVLERAPQVSGNSLGAVRSSCTVCSFLPHTHRSKARPTDMPCLLRNIEYTCAFDTSRACSDNAHAASLSTYGQLMHEFGSFSRMHKGSSDILVSLQQKLGCIHAGCRASLHVLSRGYTQMSKKLLCLRVLTLLSLSTYAGLLSLGQKSVQRP